MRPPYMLHCSLKNPFRHCLSCQFFENRLSQGTFLYSSDSTSVASSWRPPEAIWQCSLWVPPGACQCAGNWILASRFSLLYYRQSKCGWYVSIFARYMTGMAGERQAKSSKLGDELPDFTSLTAVMLKNHILIALPYWIFAECQSHGILLYSSDWWSVLNDSGIQDFGRYDWILYLKSWIIRLTINSAIPTQLSYYNWATRVLYAPLLVLIALYIQPIVI